MDLKDFRRNYSRGRLSRNSLLDNPISQFEVWLKEVVESEFKDPTAMILATVDDQGFPNQRYVLLKEFDENGFVFFTDTESTKGQELSKCSFVSLIFPWHLFERQVRIQGTVEHLERRNVEQYFHSRPRESQQAAASSHQSQVISSRDALEKNFNKYQDIEVIEVPKRWGGYRIKPHIFEFWQGGEYRLHDRFRYTQSLEGAWDIHRLQP